MKDSCCRFGALCACVGILFAAACDRGSLPTEPSATGGSSQLQTHLIGWVIDPLHRPLTGATVRLIAGPGADQQTESDASGRFEFLNRGFGIVTLEVSRDGFKSATRSADWLPLMNGAGLRIRLESLEPSEVPLAPGEYILTISMDLATAGDFGRLPACAGFPAEAASRTYSATVAEDSSSLFDRIVTIRGPTVFANPDLWLAIAGRFVTFHEMEYPFTDNISGFRYLNIQLNRSDEPVTVSPSTTSVRATGLFQYCELTTPMRPGGWENCQFFGAERAHTCHANTALVFTKR
jgi:hypothetical protein